VHYQHSAGSGSPFTDSEPYLELMDKVKPIVSKLVEELVVQDTSSPPELSARGGRLSLR